MGKTHYLRTQFDTINTEMVQRQAVIKSREPLQQVIDEYHTIVDRGGGFTDDLRVIYGSAEQLGTEIRSITHAGSAITVICQADNYTAFRDFLITLEETGHFSTPIPPPEGYPYIEGGTIKLVPETGK